MSKPTNEQWNHVVNRTRNLEHRLGMLGEKDFMALRVFLEYSKDEQKED